MKSGKETVVFLDFFYSLSLSLSLTLCYERGMVQDFVFENCR